MTFPFSNPIGFLQEFCQKRRGPWPVYHEMGASGLDHCREFSYKCEYDGLEVTGVGYQKKEAKFNAAIRMIELLKENDYLYSTNHNYESSIPSQQNPISALLEHCQASRYEWPEFHYFKSPDSAARFVCECSLLGHKVYGYGKTKISAKTEAAHKMCIRFNIFDPKEEMNESEYEEVDEELPIKKGSISDLEKFCSQFEELPFPVYEDKGTKAGLRIIVCTVGSMSAKGKYPTKKGAKLLAANKVHQMLVASISAKSGISRQPKTVRNASTANPFQEFNSDSGERDVNRNSKDDESLGFINKRLHSLRLNASEEVDPWDAESGATGGSTENHVLDQLKAANKILSKTICEFEKTNKNVSSQASSSAHGNGEQRVFVRARYDYLTSESDKLSFKKGDLIEKLDNGKELWCYGRKDGHVGLYPYNYVEPVPWTSRRH